MKLYEHPFSPNCRKVRAVADELGIALELVRVDLLRGASKTPEYLALNPNGKVPVLCDGDFVLWESNAILSYLATQAGKLLPSNPRERADVDRWMAWQLAHLGPAISKVSYERIVKKLTGQGTPDQAAIEQGAAEFHRLSAVLEASLGSKEYLAGRLSIADFALASHYSIAPTAGLEVAKYSKIDAWLHRILARDSMKRALAAAQAAMQ